MIAPLSVTVGLMLLSVALWDAFSTVVLPRTVGVVLRPARLFYGVGWRLWRVLGSRFSNRRPRQIFLTTFGPLSVFLLLGLWALMILVAFALLHLGLRTHLSAPAKHSGLGVLLYLSGTTFFTLGLGDVVPLNPLGRTLVVAEVGTGIVFLAMIIGYLPLLEQAYAQREVGVQLLESRAALAAALWTAGECRDPSRGAARGRALGGGAVAEPHCAPDARILSVPAPGPVVADLSDDAARQLCAADRQQERSARAPSAGHV